MTHGSNDLSLKVNLKKQARNPSAMTKLCRFFHLSQRTQKEAKRAPVTRGSQPPTASLLLIDPLHAKDLNAIVIEMSATSNHKTRCLLAVKFF